MSSLKDTNSNYQNTVQGSQTADGEVFIDKSGVLTRLNYFDGKFLRAADLQLEQAALLSQMRLANQASGGGLIHGFDCVLSGGDGVTISSGLAYDWQGRALLLSQDVQLSLGDMLAQSPGTETAEKKRELKRAEFSDCDIVSEAIDPGNVLLGEQHYLLVISHVEAFCGEEDVYGKLCSEACISDTQRTHIVEGIRLSLQPLILSQPLKQSSHVTLTQKHLRSRVTSAFYQQEQSAISSLISQQGLAANTWCLGAEALTGQGIPIALLSRRGAATIFLDAWGVRRERIDTPAEIYWAARMAMRAKQVYWAQILQFQCQLRDCLGSYDPHEPPLASDPCAEEKALIQSATGDMKALLRFYADVSTRLTDVSSIAVAKIATLDVNALKASIGRLEAASATRLSQQLLIDCGIVELPSAGYLPVAPDSDVTINQQVRQLLGDGVDLRFCSVRPDYVHHAIEEAQHMQRICLLKGLDDTSQREQVDILVPDGVINQQQTQIQSPGYQAHLDSSDTLLGMSLYIVAKSFSQSLQKKSVANEMLMNSVSDNRKYEFSNIRMSSGRLDLGGTMAGAARADIDGPGIGFYLATENNFSTEVNDTNVDGDVNFWGQMHSSENLFSLSSGQRANLNSRFAMDASLGYPQRDTQVQMDILVELNIGGQLIAERIEKRGAQTQVQGRFIGDIAIRYRTTINGEVNNQIDSTPLNDTLTVTRTETALGNDYLIRVPSPALFGDLDVFELVYEQKHNAAGQITLRGYLIIRGNEGVEERDFLSGHLLPDNEVLNAGNSFYTRSMLAINNIANSLDNPGFAEMSSNLLFPAPQSLPDALSVTGAYPWVVFHRRRERQCGQTQAPVVVAPARDYQVFQVTVDEKMTRERLLALIEGGFDVLVADAVAIDSAQFAANSQILSSPHDSLQGSWQQKVGAAANVLVSVIASQGDVLTEGAALASARLLSCNSVLQQVANFDGDVPLVVRETVPARLNIQQNDGALVYFSQKAAVRADCHALYQVLSNNPDNVERQIQDAIVKYNSGSTETTFDWLFNNDMARKLPLAPAFKQNSEEYIDATVEAQLKEVWLAAGGEYATHTAVLYPQQTPDVAEVAAKQRDTILETTRILEPEPGENRAQLAVPGGMLDACQRATVLLVASQCHQVYLVAFAGRDDELIPGARVGDAERAQLDPIFTEFDNGYSRGQATYYQLGELVFYWDDKQPVKTSAQAFSQSWASQVANNPALASALNQVRTMAAYSAVQLRRDNDGNVNADPSADQARNQAANLTTLMSLPGTVTYIARETDNQGFPTPCPVVTFVVLDTIGANAAVGEFTRAVRFNQNNELIRGPQFEDAIKAFADSGANVAEIELAYDADADKPAAQARAKALKAALVERGVAARNTKVGLIKRDRNDPIARKQVNLVLRN